MPAGACTPRSIFATAAEIKRAFGDLFCRKSIDAAPGVAPNGPWRDGSGCGRLAAVGRIVQFAEADLAGLFGGRKLRGHLGARVGRGGGRLVGMGQPGAHLRAGLVRTGRRDGRRIVQLAKRDLAGPLGRRQFVAHLGARFTRSFLRHSVGKEVYETVVRPHPARSAAPIVSRAEQSFLFSTNNPAAAMRYVLYIASSPRHVSWISSSTTSRSLSKSPSARISAIPPKPWTCPRPRCRGASPNSNTA